MQDRSANSKPLRSSHFQLKASPGFGELKGVKCWLVKLKFDALFFLVLFLQATIKIEEK